MIDPQKSERYIKYSEILFSNGFSEAKQKAGHFFRQATESTAFVVNFEDDEENSENKNNFKKVFHKYKAYSYCGTVCRNYLVYKCAQYAKKKLRNSSYEDVYDDINNDERFSTDDDNFSSHAEALVSKIIHEIESMINKKVENGLTENEVKVGKSLITLFRDWERVLPNEGSKKLQKSSILYYLREDTLMTTKELRDNMRRYKLVYYLLKENEIK